MSRSINESLQEYARGIAGGLLFSLPLLYTMEVWWAGFIAQPLRLVAYICATFVLLLGYNRYAGLRHDASWAEVAIDSVEEMGLGLVVAAVILWLLGRFTLETTPDEIVGKIVIEAMTVAIGVSVGTAQLGGGGNGNNAEQKDTGMRGATAGAKHRAASGGAGSEEIHFGGQLVLAACGAFLFAANVAPTEEILMIASEIPSWRLVGIALLSFALGALILYFSEFHDARRFVRSDSISMISGTVLTYAVALVCSALILWFFGRFDNQAFVICLAQTVTLGLAATMGASAGRLLLQ